MNPQLASISRTPNQMLDPRPNAGSPALTGALFAAGDNVEQVSYRGAFSNTRNWAEKWTALDQYGYFGDKVTIPVEVITDESVEAGDTLILTADREWILDGYVFVEENACIVIEPGTVVKGRVVPTTGDQASALIITRDGCIKAEGTAQAPIIFTSETDDLNSSTDLTAADNQLWGGVIILGDAPIGEDGGTDVIEGIPSDEPRIAYGGNEPADNSGIMTYVSIRHGGAVLGGDNEINGLSLGGVGNGTEIDYIEVFANKDDGIEFFGGTVNVKHAVVSFAGDDAFDFDESWAGTIQFAFGLVGTTNGVGEHLFEYDGSEAANRQPKTIGKIYNGTFIGGGVGGTNTASRGLRLREDAAAQFWNCIWTDVTDYMFRIEGTSIDRMAAGESAFAANIINGYATLNRGNVPALTTALGLNNNQIDVNPQLAGISRTPTGGLDPRPNASSPALNGALFAPSDNVEQVTYRGAFSNSENWALNWTAMDEYGYFGDLVIISSVDYAENESGLKLGTPYPNPATADIINVDFTLPGTSDITMQVYDFTGKLMSTSLFDNQLEGKNTVTLSIATLQTGMYVVALQSDFGTVTRKFIVENRK